MMRVLPVLLLATSVAIASGEGDRCGDPRVAFSFDDPPRDDTAIMTGEERTRRIIRALTDGGVDQAMFFAVSSRIDDRNIQRIRDYVDAGHVIASHSHTHANLHRVGADLFLEDVAIAHGILSDLPGFQPFFRFPYLNEGSTREERDTVRAGLADLGYRAGYVTIDNYDFYIDRLLLEATEAGQDIDLDRVAGLYLDMILGAAAHYDQVACRWLGRSPAHVLLLHENDVAALFLTDLIAGFRSAGWTPISVSEAYQDPIAARVPDTLFLGQGQVAALAAVAGADEADLRHEGEDTDVLTAAFQAAIIAGED